MMFCFKWRDISNSIVAEEEKVLETPGFEPGASYMRSKRSTAELRPHEAGIPISQTSCNWQGQYVALMSIVSPGLEVVPVSY